MDAEMVEKIRKRLVEGRLELHGNDDGFASKRAGEGAGLVFVAGLSVGENQDFSGGHLISSFTARRIWRLARAMPPLIVHPEARRCPPPPKRVARAVNTCSLILIMHHYLQIQLKRFLLKKIYSV